MNLYIYNTKVFVKCNKLQQLISHLLTKNNDTKQSYAKRITKQNLDHNI